MIARIWRGVTREADKDTYFEYLQKTGLKEYASITGNQGVWVLRRVDDGKSEFTLISLWDSWDAIKAFAGPDPEKAVFYPEDDKVLAGKRPAREPLRSPVMPVSMSVKGMLRQPFSFEGTTQLLGCPPQRRSSRSRLSFCECIVALQMR